MTKVIIVEDDPMVAKLNAQYLNQLPELTVCGSFHNGQDALAYLRTAKVDLAVVDMYMPVLNGLELLRALRGSGIGTSVILITAATDMHIVEEALRLGIEDYIVKPFRYARLLEAVQTYLDKAKLVRQQNQANQDVIDRLLGRDRESSTRELRKGLNARTLQSLQELLLADARAPQTCESLSVASGLSKVTVRNYLNYLIEVGQLESTIDYETGGRPRVLYRLKGTG